MSTAAWAVQAPHVAAEPLEAVRVDRIDDAAAASWDAYVDAQPAAALYHRYAWRRVVQGFSRGETYYLAARDRAGAIRGVLPLARLRSRLFGDFLVSLPYFNYGGVVADSVPVRAALLDAATTLGRDLGVQHVELRHTESLTGGDWQTRTDKVTFLLDLPSDPGVLSHAIGAKLRSQIRRPVKEGATVESGGVESGGVESGNAALLSAFHDVFARKMRDLGTPVYPQSFFASVLAAAPHSVHNSARVFVVRLGGVPVASAIVLGARDTLEIPWAASLREADRYSVNMLLYWSVLEYAIGHGYRVFDFGRCTPDSGPYRFKKQWGARVVQLHWHYWLRDGGELPRLNHSNPKFQRAVEMWRKLPLGVTKWLGPRIVRHLP